MASRIIKIMLVDDHVLVRQGLKLLIESEKDMKVVAEAENGDVAIKVAQLNNPDIIIMDINMPVLDGLESIRIMKDTGVLSKIIILTGSIKKDNILKASKLGVRGYLIKDTNSVSLIKAIRDVYIGRNFIASSATSILSHITSDDNMEQTIDMNKIKNLSKREYEVLLMLSAGHNNKTIGKELFISEKTVKNHITNIFKKLEVKDRVQAAIFAYHNSII